MHTLKTFLTFALSVLFAISLTACSDDDSSSMGSSDAAMGDKASSSVMEDNGVIYEEEIYKDWPYQ